MDFANAFDIGMLIVTLYFSVKGIIRGFVREIMSMVGFIGGAWLALKYSEAGGLYIRRLFTGFAPSFANTLAMALIFIIVTLLCALIGQVIRKILKSADLSFFDRFFGLLAGLIKSLAIAFLLVNVLAYVQTMFPKADVSQTVTAVIVQQIQPYVEPLKERIPLTVKTGIYGRNKENTEGQAAEPEQERKVFPEKGNTPGKKNVPGKKINQRNGV